MADKENKNLLLEIKNLKVEVQDKCLLRDVNLSIREGETHIVFGPNGSGKTTLVNVIMGLPGYKISKGDIIYKGNSIIDWSLTKRARAGIGLAFQHPPVIEGVFLESLLKTITTDVESAYKFAEETGMEDYLNREINVGFSGGERKKDELLQLLAQSPQLIMFDEPDSGVDFDSVKLIVRVIRNLLEKEKPILKRERSGIIVTHSGAILEGIHADRGYVIVDGRIFCSGAPLDILDQIKNFGFEKCIKEARESEKSG